MAVRDIVTPLVLRPSRRGGLGAFRVSLDPLDGAGAGKQAFTVPQERVTGAVGVASEDVPLLELPDEALTVGVDGAAELEVREELERPGERQ